MNLTAGTVTTVVLVAGAVWFFLVPLVRTWPDHLPEARRLKRLSGVREYLSQFAAVSKAMPSLRKIPKDQRVSPRLSEMIMLTVCGVNQCAHCSYLHSRTALEKGVSEDEIRELLAGQVSGASAADLPALLFAQHFADTGGNVSSEAQERVIRQYGPGTVRSMEAYLLSVYFGNLCCNTVQYFERGGLDLPERIKSYIAYLLAKPVSWFIVKSASRRNAIQISSSK